MVGYREHVNTLEVTAHRERADQLRAVNKHHRPNVSGQAADRGDVGPVAGRRLHATERNKPRTSVHALADVFGLEPAVAEGYLPDVISLLRQLAPGKMVRAVLPFPDHDVVTRAGRAELSSHQSRRRRH